MRKRMSLDYAAGRDNPNAIYKEGREAKAKLESARARIAKVLSVATDEIIFTPWGTEANLAAALPSLAPSEPREAGSPRWSFGEAGQSTRHGQGGGHAITTLIEHKSVLDAFKSFKNITYLRPDSQGLVTAKQVEEALRPNTKLVSIMYANNEIGTIQPIKEITRMLRAQDHKIYFHSDCVQAPGLLPINMQSLGLDTASFSAPKFGGPAGAAFLFARRGTLIDRPRDACPVPLALQMAAALELAEKHRERETARLTKLRNYFIKKVLTEVPGTSLNGLLENRLANNANLIFPVESELIVLELDAVGIAASAGAACSSGECGGGSHVILALGKSKKEANSSVRFSLGRDTKKSDLDYVIKALVKIINKHTNLWQTK